MSLDTRTESAEPSSNGLSNAPQRAPRRGRSLGRALLAAAREPLAVLDRSFRVTAANRPYYRLFPANFSAPAGQPFCQPVPPSWNAFVLQTLNDVIALDILAEDIEIELDVPGAGMRRMLLNAQRICDSENPDDAVAVGLTDVSALRQIERDTSDATDQHALLLQEAHHRIANSLQIIASILLLKARSVESEETRNHLRDVHKRLILVATVQRQLCSSGMLDELEFGPYVAQLCGGLARSMTDGDGRVTILTSSSEGKIKADDAVSFGLIVTELVLNALKHGFPGERRGAITVTFHANASGWRLSVSDDGVGYTDDAQLAHTGLGTSIVEALARHLKAKVEIAQTGVGSSTAIVHTAPVQQAS